MTSTWGATCCEEKREGDHTQQPLEPAGARWTVPAGVWQRLAEAAGRCWDPPWGLRVLLSCSLWAAAQFEPGQNVPGSSRPSWQT